MAADVAITIAVYADWAGMKRPMRLGHLQVRRGAGREAFEFEYDAGASADPVLGVTQLDPRIAFTWKYRYQVASQDSPDLHAVDWAHSDEHMRDRHFYEVQMNDDMRHPQTLGVLREVPRNEV